MSPFVIPRGAEEIVAGGTQNPNEPDNRGILITNLLDQVFEEETTDTIVFVADLTAAFAELALVFRNSTGPK
jgi:hypothetical protein